MNTVYGIRCLVNEKFYIGGTTNMVARKNLHLRSLRSGTHHSRKLQRAWDKHKEENFQFEIIESLEGTIEDLFVREQFWIDHHDAYYNGYNGRAHATPCPAGERNGMFGKESHNKGKACPNRKPVVSYCIRTGEVEFFDYLSEVCKKYPQIGPQFIGCMTRDKILKNGYSCFHSKFWFYILDFSLENLKFRFDIKNAPNPLIGRKRPETDCRSISEGRKGMTFSSNHKRNLSLAKIGKGTRKVLRNDGKEFESVKAAAEATGCDPTMVSHNLSGKTKTCYGFKFAYLTL